MHAYFEDLDLRGYRIDDALRAFVGSFRLSGEAGPINYMMEKFASLYNEHNPESTGANADSTLIAAYAILMLNTRYVALLHLRFSATKFVESIHARNVVV